MLLPRPLDLLMKIASGTPDVTAPDTRAVSETGLDPTLVFSHVHVETVS